MAADRRNASVVFALIASMTIGLVVLLWLESQLVPKRLSWAYSTLLAAREGIQIASVEISYVPVTGPVDENALNAIRGDFEPDDSICWILPDGRVAPLEWSGPRVRMVVIGSSDETELSDQQKLTLLGALATLSQEAGVALVPVRLTADSDYARNPGLPLQTKALREFLEHKGIIEARSVSGA